MFDENCQLAKANWLNGQLAKANWLNGQLVKENWRFDTSVAAQNCWSEKMFHHHRNTLGKRAKRTNPKKTCKIKNL